MRFCTTILAVSVTVFASGCTVSRAFIRGEDVAKISRGETFAQAHCATCHAVDRGSASPRADAPPFVVLARRYRQDSLVWELEASATVGHYGMPVVSTQAADREALAAYVLGLRPHEWSVPTRR